MVIALKDRKCGCVIGFYQCGRCEGIEQKAIWAKMTAKQRDYDRYVDPHGSAALDRSIASHDADGCSCHISPPCNYCTRETLKE